MASTRWYDGSERSAIDLFKQRFRSCTLIGHSLEGITAQNVRAIN